MLNMSNYTYSFSGTSKEGTTNLATFSAGYSDGGVTYFSYNLEDMAVYHANRATFEADLIDFTRNVANIVSRIQGVTVPDDEEPNATEE